MTDDHRTSRPPCPQCGALLPAGSAHSTQCPNCHYHVIQDDGAPTLDAAALAALLHNVRLRLADVAPGQFQQMTGLYSGRGDADGIGFDRDSAETVARYLTGHDVLCTWFSVRADGGDMETLVLAKDAHGLDRGLRKARKAASRARAVLRVNPLRSNG